MRKINVVIHRYNVEKGKYIQNYSVEITDEQELSVMNLLEYIYKNIDDTLSFFHHAACRQAICGGCMLKVNGKSVLACKQLVEGCDITLEPINEKVFRDLVCE